VSVATYLRPVLVCSSVPVGRPFSRTNSS